MAAQNMAAGQKHKQQATGASPDDWTTRERLILASSVVRSGDQNWVSVSRAIKPVAEHGPSARPRPPDFFSQKNCAVHYSNMLEKVATPKRKRNEGGGTETPGDQIVRTLTFERMEELKKSIKSDHLTFRRIKARIEDIKNGKLDHQLQAMCNEIEIRRKRREGMQSKASSSQVEADANLPATPTTPTPVTPLPGGSRQGMQPLPSPQKGKQQRIPKPTEKFQKYQQQQRQRHGHASQQAQYPGQPSEATTSSGIQPDSPAQNKMPGMEQAAALGRTQMLRRESTELESRSDMSTGSHNQSVTPTGAPPSPWKHEPVPHSPAIPPARQTPGGNCQVPGESALLSLLSQPPKDLKQTVIELSEQEQPERKESGQHPSSSVANPQPSTPTKEKDSQHTDGKPFLGVGPSVEPKKLDSIRDRRASTSQVPAVSVAAPSVSAPTLSKLLTSATSSEPVEFNASPSHTTAPKSASVTKASIVSEVIVGSADGNSLLGRRGGGIIVGGRGEGGGAPVATLSFSPKTAVKAALPSPMAITPPPNTPPADKKEMIVESLVETEKKNTIEQQNAVTETAGVKCEEPVRPTSSSKDLGEEPKVEGGEAVESTPKMTTRTRASKPGRPGRPPKILRKPPLGRTRSSNSTDNEVEVEESQSEVEAMDVESEKTSEKGEDEDESLSTSEDKKAESTVDEEEEEGGEAEQEDDGEEEGSVDDGDGSQSGEAMSSLKELIEKQDLTGSESVPASPSSQVSFGSGDDPEAVQAQKTWRKSIMLVWRAAANHKYANVFLHPVTDDEAPGYHTVVFRPMDLTTIKKSIENGTIRTTSEFQRDMMLMFQNALMYNNSDHDVYRMAAEMRDDVMEQIQSYIATQLMVRSSDRESKMLRGHRTDVFHFFL